VKETSKQKLAMKKLVAELSKPCISASGKVALQALVRSQKTFPKP
jgi:hypothetical protein